MVTKREHSGVAIDPLMNVMLQALNNSETLRLLACIELACYRSMHATIDPRNHYKNRRRVERAIKDDRRRRHKRRKEADAMVEAFAAQTIDPLEGPPIGTQA